MYPVIKGRGAAFLPLSPRFAVLPSGPLTFVGCNKEEVVVDNKKLAGESELITPVLSMPVCHTGGRSLMLRKSMSTNLDEVNRRRREQGHAELDPTELRTAARYGFPLTLDDETQEPFVHGGDSQDRPPEQ